MSQINVGISVLIIKDNKLLLGKRKGEFGGGEWGLPGGHLEQNEKFLDAAGRELMEETGLKAQKFIFLNIINQYKEKEHYVQISFLAEGVEGEPELLEPEECEVWQWFDLDDLPPNVYGINKDQVALFKKKENFME